MERSFQDRCPAGETPGYGMDSSIDLCDPRKHKGGIVDIVEMLKLIGGWSRPYN